MHRDPNQHRAAHHGLRRQLAPWHAMPWPPCAHSGHAADCHNLQFLATHCMAMPCRATPCHATPRHALPHHATPCHGATQPHHAPTETSCKHADNSCSAPARDRAAAEAAPPAATPAAAHPPNEIDSQLPICRQQARGLVSHVVMHEVLALAPAARAVAHTAEP